MQAMAGCVERSDKRWVSCSGYSSYRKFELCKLLFTIYASYEVET